MELGAILTAAIKRTNLPHIDTLTIVSANEGLCELRTNQWVVSFYRDPRDKIITASIRPEDEPVDGEIQCFIAAKIGYDVDAMIRFEALTDPMERELAFVSHVLDFIAREDDAWTKLSYFFEGYNACYTDGFT